MSGEGDDGIICYLLSLGSKTGGVRTKIVLTFTDIGVPSCRFRFTRDPVAEGRREGKRPRSPPGVVARLIDGWTDGCPASWESGP